MRAVPRSDADGRHARWLDDAVRRVAPISPWALRLLSMSPDDAGNGRWLSELVATDPALLARVLGTANSHAFNPRGDEVADVGHAIRRLGTREVWRIATVVALGASSRTRPELRPAKRALWMHSFTVAHAARQFARAAGREGAREDRSYVAALLHDIGLMVLLGVEPDRCRAMLARVADPAVGFGRAVEQEAGLPPHARIGAEVCRRWGLSDDLVALVGGHGEVHPLDHPPALRACAAALELGHQVTERELRIPGLYRLPERDDLPLLCAFLRVPAAAVEQVRSFVREAAPRIAAVADSA